ncbi:MAG: hypothetical protein OXI35_14715 [Gemmatimonadota bacterium]|nr:hypothetical protein [Gemmatimonadota bacterium]
MKTGLLILCTLLAATVSFGQTNTNDAIVGGIVITTPPELSQRPSCNASTQNFIFVDYSNGQSTVCRSGSWVNLAVDVDGDGITAALDANDADASDLGDSDLTAENIKQGVVIFDGKASEITGTATTTPVVDGSSFSITPATTPSASEQTARRTVPAGTYDGTEEVTHVVQGDSDLAGNNIRGGVDIFGVAGSLTERGSFSMPATTPGKSNTTARKTIPAGVYDGDEEVSHKVNGDSDLIANNIRGGVDIFGVAGSLTERDSFSMPATTPGKSNTTTSKTIPAGVYDGNEQVTHLVRGDSDLTAGNIKDDVTIFGVTGTYEGDITSSTSPPYTTINAGYNSYTDYVLSGGSTSADAYCVARGHHEASAYSKNAVGNKGISVNWTSSRFVVTAGCCGGYSAYSSITCKTYSE